MVVADLALKWITKKPTCSIGRGKAITIQVWKDGHCFKFRPEPQVFMTDQPIPDCRTMAAARREAEKAVRERLAELMGDLR
jgi:hypothetical protein